MFTIQFNDGRTYHDVPSGEARMWLIISTEAIGCNVYKVGGSGMPLCFI